jgi:UDP-2,3-diacylglucosamine pyrophosphatase LpxH
MPSYMKRVDRAFATAPVLPVGGGSRIAVLSDCHRGTGTPADDFAPNRCVFLAALGHYDRLSYTYIELGDGDELWENRSMEEIKAAYGDVFLLLRKFYAENRLWLLYGNHDMEKKCAPAPFDAYCDAVTSKEVPLFPGAVIHEGLRLRYAPAGRDFFLLHGHQVDFLNDTLWRLARFLVRNVWRRLELIGVNDPTSAAKNHKVKRKTERRLTRWARANGVPLLAGHTHRPVFPLPGEGRYFNDGCCVHPGYVTAMEIAEGRIALVKWGQKAREDGAVYIGRDVIAGPVRLEAYFA